MEPFDWTRLPEHLEQCHGALMVVWNRYREEMTRRGFNTEEVVNSLEARCWERRAQFDGTTVEVFCGWSRIILTNWIKNELDRRRAGQFPTSFDAGDSAQPRPSQDYDSFQMRLVGEAARSRLTDDQIAMFDALNDHPVKDGVIRPKPIPNRVRTYLDTHHPGLRQTHPEWEENATLAAACNEAWDAFDKHAREIYHDLERGEGPGECAPE